MQEQLGHGLSNNSGQKKKVFADFESLFLKKKCKNTISLCVLHIYKSLIQFKTRLIFFIVLESNLN